MYECCAGDPPGIAHTFDCPEYIQTAAAFEADRGRRPRTHTEDGVTWTEPTDGTCGFPYPFRAGEACPLVYGHSGPHEPRRDFELRARARQLRDAILEMTSRYGDSVYQYAYQLHFGNAARAGRADRARDRRFVAIMRLTRSLADLAGPVL